MNLRSADRPTQKGTAKPSRGSARTPGGLSWGSRKTELKWWLNVASWFKRWTLRKYKHRLFPMTKMVGWYCGLFWSVDQAVWANNSGHAISNIESQTEQFWRFRQGLPIPRHRLEQGEFTSFSHQKQHPGFFEPFRLSHSFLTLYILANLPAHHRLGPSIALSRPWGYVWLMDAAIYCGHWRDCLIGQFSSISTIVSLLRTFRIIEGKRVSLWLPALDLVASNNRWPWFWGDQESRNPILGKVKSEWLQVPKVVVAQSCKTLMGIDLEAGGFN